MPLLTHIPGRRPIVLNDGYDPRTPKQPTAAGQKVAAEKSKPQVKQK